MESGKTAHQPFPHTRWTLVAKASDAGSTVGKVALEELCQIYWRPVYTFIQFKGYSVEEAEDLTQGFFADFLKRESFSDADGKSGKLRNYILDAVTKFMAKDYRYETRLKRGGTEKILSLDMQDENGNAVLEPADGITPEKLFKKQWALTTLEGVFNKLEKRYTKRGDAELFEAIKFKILANAKKETYASIAARLGVNESAIKTAVHRLRARYGKALREAVADTLMDGEDVEAELRELMNVFS